MTETSEEMRMIENLKRIMDHFSRCTHSIELLLGFVQKPLVVDDRGLAGVLRRITEKICEITQSIENLDLTKTFGEIKYIGKRLNEIEIAIKNIQEKGIKKQIHLDFTCDGYQMVKKKINNHDDNYFEEESDYEDMVMIELLRTLSERESTVIRHRLGLLGEKKKTLAAIGKIFGVTRERIGQIYVKGMRKLRHPSRRLLLDKITHKELLRELKGD